MVITQCGLCRWYDSLLRKLAEDIKFVSAVTQARLTAAGDLNDDDEMYIANFVELSAAIAIKTAHFRLHLWSTHKVATEKEARV